MEEKSVASVFESERFRVWAMNSEVKNLEHYADMCEEALDRLAPGFVLQKPNRGKIEARVCASRKEFEKAAGRSGENTMAVAIPSKGVMILNGEALMRADSAERFRTVGHEMVHLLLGRLAAGGEASVPGWLHEGLAQLLTGEHGRLGSVRLAWANLRDKRIPMRRLADAFPYGTSQSELAYAQSASFTLFVSAEHFKVSPGDFFRGLLGNPQQAPEIFAWLGQAGNLAALETRWRAASGGVSNWIYILTSGTLLWAFIVVLFLVAYARKRRKMKTVMEDWDPWERED